MISDLQKNLEAVTGFRENRMQFADLIFANPTFLEELIQICFQVSNENSHRACWILELVAYQKLHWLQLHLDFFCTNLKVLKHESAIRPISKICLLLATSHFKKSEIQLTELHFQKITEASFDWLLNDAKVATKCYAMRTLFEIGKQSEWIYTEMKIILAKDYNSHTYAYKAVAREILKKMK
jgi:hypothetical protein